MNKLILSTVLLLGSCCQPNQTRLPTKIEYLRIGFDNGKESYLQTNSTSIYKIRYNNLNMQVLEQTCNDFGYETIAKDVNFFSIVSEQEYNIKHLGVESTPQSTSNIY